MPYPDAMQTALTQRQRGFTLIEAIMVITITGILAGVVAIFIRTPIQSYFDVERRAEMTDTADTALRRIGRDVRLAVPNSVRVTDDNQAIEFLQTITGGRYRSAGPEELNLSTETKTFNVLGDMTLDGKIKLSDIEEGEVVIYNLSTEVDNPTNAYSGQNRAKIASATANSITLKVPKLFSVAPDYVLGSYEGKRFQVVDTPVTYRCSNNTLTRYWGYAISSGQLNPPNGGSNAVLAQNVSACNFTYEVGVTQRNSLVSMQIAITKNNETVTLYHEVHVSNVP